MIKTIFHLTTTPMEAPQLLGTPDYKAFRKAIIHQLLTLSPDATISPLQKSDPGQPVSGFYLLDSAVLVYDSSVYKSMLGPVLRHSGNIHPTTLNDTGEELYFFNATATYDCLNLAETFCTSPTGEKEYGVIFDGHGMAKFAFFPERIGDSPIFRMPQTKDWLYVATDGSGDANDFYTLYQASGFKGLSFKEVWTRDEA